MSKAEAYAYWRSRTRRYRGRWVTLEEGRWVPGTSSAAFWRTVQRLERLKRSDPGGNIVIR